jgi:AcrR family transcriptional regulator
MVQSAAVLIRARGVEATSFSDVIAHSGAPRGSIYHHFPGGKEQLTEAAIRWTSDEILAYLRAAPDGPPAAVLAHFIGLWRNSVAASNGSSGCPIAGVAVDTAAGAAVMVAARDAFRAWSDLLASQLTNAGLAAGRAASIASTSLACMEGALILCRAEQSSAPLEIAAAELVHLLGP